MLPIKSAKLVWLPMLLINRQRAEHWLSCLSLICTTCMCRNYSVDGDGHRNNGLQSRCVRNRRHAGRMGMITFGSRTVLTELSNIDQ